MRVLPFGVFRHVTRWLANHDKGYQNEGPTLRGIST